MQNTATDFKTLTLTLKSLCSNFCLKILPSLSQSGLDVDGEDDTSVTSENRFMFGGKQCDDFVAEAIGGLRPKYNFKAPFDRYQPIVVRNVMGDLFR